MVAAVRPRPAERERAMDRVIFLDRDGTINEEVHYLHRAKDFRLLPGVEEALRRFRGAGYKVVVVTNQSGVARGYYGEEDVERLHDYVDGLLRPRGAGIDHFFYCPHHPEHGIGVYRASCRCRKPGTGMLEMAQQYYEIDKSQSWMIGDKLTDIQAGNRFGVHTALVGTGYGAQVHARQCASGERPPYELYGRRLDELAKEILAAGGYKEDMGSNIRRGEADRC